MVQSTTATLPNTSATPVPGPVYASSFGSDPSVLSVNDLMQPPIQTIIAVPTTPPWVWAIGGILLLSLISRKKVL